MVSPKSPTRRPSPLLFDIFTVSFFISLFLSPLFSPLSYKYPNPLHLIHHLFIPHLPFPSRTPLSLLIPHLFFPFFFSSMEEDQVTQLSKHLQNTTLTLSDEDNLAEDDVAEEDYEFTFASGSGEMSSPVAAEEVFHNGQIRAIFPFSGEREGSTSTSNSVRKVFVKTEEEGEFCEWTAAEATEEQKEKAPEMRRKSNSTGFSRLRRVKDLLLVRSHSDGKDAFVFLNNNGGGEERERSRGGEEKVKEKGKEKKEKKQKKKGVVSNETASFGELYGRRERGVKGEREKKKSVTYLPYRQDLLVGFFTSSVTGLSRNVHPY